MGCAVVGPGRPWVWPVLKGALTGGYVPPACISIVAWVRVRKRKFLFCAGKEGTLWEPRQCAGVDRWSRSSDWW